MTDEFRKFIKKGATGAAKIQAAAKKTGGYAEYGLKLYAQDNREEMFKTKYQESYNKLQDIDKISQRQLQFITGELEAYGPCMVSYIFTV